MILGTCLVKTFPVAIFNTSETKSTKLLLYSTLNLEGSFLESLPGSLKFSDHFNSNTDRFFSEFGGGPLKQVDDMYIQGTSLEDISNKMGSVAKETLKIVALNQFQFFCWVSHLRTKKCYNLLCKEY